MHQLLFIDDDRELLMMNRQYFTRKGYRVHCVDNAPTAVSSLRTVSPDCILLDIMMPHMDGFEVCRRIRRKTAAPILFLTGRLDEASAVKGLMEGGDDYIAKPYGMAELEARIVANIRRFRMSAPFFDRTQIPPFEIDIVGRKVYYEQQKLDLSNREYELLYLLLTNPNRLVTFEEISKQVLGSCIAENRSVVMVNMSRLRKKLEHVPDCIETTWGKGYTFSPRSSD